MGPSVEEPPGLAAEIDSLGALLKSFGPQTGGAEAGSAQLKLFDSSESLLANVTVTSGAWVYDNASYDLGSLAAGERIYFAVDRDADQFFYDNIEVAFVVTRSP